MRSHFKVPVSAYVKKYLVKKFFAGDKGPYKLEEDTLIGKQFMSNIIDGRKRDFIDKHIEVDHYIEVILSQDMMSKSPRLSKLQSVNFFLDKLFKEGLIDWILSAQHYGVRPFTSTKDFLEYYGVDESEYSHDAAYKLWTRWKNRDYKKNSKKASHRRTKIKSSPSSGLPGVLPAAINRSQQAA